MTNARVSQDEASLLFFYPLRSTSPRQPSAVALSSSAISPLSAWMKVLPEMNRPPRSRIFLFFFFFSFSSLSLSFSTTIVPVSDQTASSFRYYSRDGCIRLLIRVSFAFLECFSLEWKWEDAEKETARLFGPTVLFVCNWNICLTKYFRLISLRLVVAW